MYTAVAANGTVIPPVIFTSDTNVPVGVEEHPDARVFPIPNFKGKATADTTMRWLDTVQPHLADEPLLIHDKGKEFTAAAVTQRLQEEVISSYPIPASGGAFVNPLDNSFHHELKSKYRVLTHRTHSRMLRDMVKAYYLCDESNIENYFKHCLLTGSKPTASAVRRLCSEGFVPASPHHAVLEKAQTVFRAWEKNLRIWHGSKCAASEVNSQGESPSCVVCWHKIPRTSSL